MRLFRKRPIDDSNHDSRTGRRRRWRWVIPTSLTGFVVFFIPLYIIFSILYRNVHDEIMTSAQPLFQASRNRPVPANLINVEKFRLGKKKIPFCISTDYIDRVTYYTDGTPVIHLIMFLPDLSPSKVYDRLHPIAPSPILWSPERIEYSHSILLIEVTPSYSGKADPTGKLALMQTLNNPKPFDHPASTYPVEGFDEYDDKFGQPEIYYYEGSEPYGILCFHDACSIEIIINDSLRLSMNIAKASIPGAMDIIDRFKKLVGSTECPR
jgi:hypothetical protein